MCPAGRKESGADPHLGPRLIQRPRLPVLPLATGPVPAKVGRDGPAKLFTSGQGALRGAVDNGGSPAHESRPRDPSHPAAPMSPQHPPAAVAPEAPGARTPAPRPAKPAEALGLRLRNVTTTQGRRRRVTLGQLRGSTGALREGPLWDLSAESGGCCAWPLAHQREAFYAVKGSWMLKFRRSSDGARCVGAPIPLDGARVRAVGDTEFEVTNRHAKEDFLGKGISGSASGTFVHSVCVLLEARSREARDGWVTALCAQVARLRERQERRALLSRRDGPERQVSDRTVATAAAIDGLASRLFVEFEEDEEFAALGLGWPDLVSAVPWGPCLY